MRGAHARVGLVLVAGLTAFWLAPPRAWAPMAGRDAFQTLALDTPVTGTWAEGDFGLGELLRETPTDTRPADIYLIAGMEGQALVFEVTATAPVFLVLQYPDGEALSGGGDPEGTTAEATQVMPTDGAYRVIVAPFVQAQLGDYTLNVRRATPEELQAISDEMPIDAMLTSGVPIDAQILATDEANYRTYAIDVPPGSSSLTIETTSETDVDLFVRYGLQIMFTYNTEPDYQSFTESGNETVRVTRLDSPPLREGRYYMDVVAFTLGQEGAPTVAPFRIAATVQQPSLTFSVDAPPEATHQAVVTGVAAGDLALGSRQPARIDPDLGPLQVWRVTVPEGSRQLEVRTYGATGRLDLVAVAPNAPNPASLDDLFSLPNRGLSAADNERLVINDQSSPPLQAGVYQIAVIDAFTRVASDYEIAAAVDTPLTPLVAYAPADPTELAALTPLQTAIRATVQITVSIEEGVRESGSGTIVTPDGLILTNHHVVGACALESPYLYGCVGDVYPAPDGSLALLYIGLGSEGDASAEQMFVGQVVRTLPDYDLALVHIVSDIEGRPVTGPLPTIPLSLVPEAVTLGAAINVIGYPNIATAGARSSLSVTSGTITGFTEDRGQRALLNVDANIAAGNSGGALVDEAGTLVGIPSNSRIDRDRGDKQDFARSLTLIPAEWIELLSAHGAVFL